MDIVTCVDSWLTRGLICMPCHGASLTVREFCLLLLMKFGSTKLWSFFIMTLTCCLLTSDPLRVLSFSAIEIFFRGRTTVICLTAFLISMVSYTMGAMIINSVAQRHHVIVKYIWKRSGTQLKKTGLSFLHCNKLFFIAAYFCWYYIWLIGFCTLAGFSFFPHYYFVT